MASSPRALLAAPQTALVVVDAQVDFASPHGALAATGIDMQPLARTLDRIQALIVAARAAGVQVVWLRTVTRPETDSRALRLFNERTGRDAQALAICRAGSVGAGYFRVRPEPGDIEVEKTLYSGFTGTALDRGLRGAAIDTLLFSGFTTECCVSSSVRDAFERDYSCVVVADACAAYTASLHEGALEALAASFAICVESRFVIGAWHPHAPQSAP